MPESGEQMSCSFCGTGQRQARMLICGPARLCVCDGCVRRVHEAMAGAGPAVSTPIATIQRVFAEAGAERCGFCGKRRDQVAAMASAGDPLTICDECLELCDEILAEAPPIPPR